MGSDGKDGRHILKSCDQWMLRYTERVMWQRLEDWEGIGKKVKWEDRVLEYVIRGESQRRWLESVRKKCNNRCEWRGPGNEASGKTVKQKDSAARLKRYWEFGKRWP